MDWLVSHGIDRTGLQPWPAGHNDPITDNESPSEIQRNERIILQKNTLTGATNTPHGRCAVPAGDVLEAPLCLEFVLPAGALPNAAEVSQVTPP